MKNFHIGLVGTAGAGKDTAAEILVKNGWTRIAFADPVRQLLYDINPQVATSSLRDLVDTLGWEVAKRESVEIRRLLVEVGMGVRSMVGDDSWVGVAMRRAAEVDGPVVFTDVRFANEAAMMDGLIRVVRPGVVGGGDRADVSAAGLEVDVTVVNDGNVELLGCRVMAAVGILVGSS